MKKFILILFFLAVVMVFDLAKATMTITPNNSNPKVGDKVIFTIKGIDLGTNAKYIEFYINQSLKKKFDVTNPTSATYPPYTWDTKEAQSVAGSHTATAKLLNSSYTQIDSKTITFNLAAASSNTENADQQTSSGKVFDLEKLGKVTFQPTKVDNLTDLILTAIKFLFGLIGALAIIAIAYSGIMYITAGPDPAKAESAKKNLTWAIIGFVIAGFAFYIVQIVLNVLAQINK